MQLCVATSAMLANDKRSTQSNVFWLCYVPGRDESLEDGAEMLRRALCGTARDGYPHGLWMVEAVRDGSRVVKAMVCTPTRVRVSSAVSSDKLQRKGARGTVCELRWPEQREAPHDFLQRLSAVMRDESVGDLGGSEIELARVMTVYYENERERMRDRRGSVAHAAVRRPRLTEVFVEEPKQADEVRCLAGACAEPRS